MDLLTKKELIESLDSESADSLFLDPILDREQQIGHVTIDLRLGYDFQVSTLTRNPYISITETKHMHHRGIESYFQETRREVGELFVLYPNQVVVSTSLEYLSLPSNVYADIFSRSSYTRLGLQLNTMVQPGFRGCVPFELFNHGNNVIELVVGSRICQARFFKAENDGKYTDSKNVRKYFGDVRPTVSKADSDKDLAVLKTIRENKD